MKTPTGFVALRNGRHNIRNCIFLNWFDAEEFITDFNNAEYSVLDSLKDAEEYIIANNDSDKVMNSPTQLGSTDSDKYFRNDSTKTVTTARIATSSPSQLFVETIDDFDIDIDDYIHTFNPSDAVQQYSYEQKTSNDVDNTKTTTQGRLPAINKNENSGHNNDITKNTATATNSLQTLSTTQTPVHVPFIATSANKKSPTTKNSNSTTCNNKLWKECFDKYMSYKNPNDGTFPQPIPDSNVQVWLHLQGIECGKKLQGLPNSLSDEKLEMLHNAGIVFFIHESVHAQALLYVKKQLQQQPKPSSTVAVVGNGQQKKKQQQQQQNKIVGDSPSAFLFQKQRPFQSSPSIVGNAGIIFFNHESIHTQELPVVRKQQRQQPSSPGGGVGNGQQQQQQQQNNNNSYSSVALLFQNQKPFSLPIVAGKEQQQKQQQYNGNSSSAQSVIKQPFSSCVVVGQGKQKQQQNNGGFSSTTPESSRPQKRAKIIYQQPIQQVWKDNLAKLKLYMDEQDGDWNVTDEHDTPFRSWILSQKDEYRLMKEGKESAFSEQKLAMLRKIGVDLDKKVYSWSDRIEQLIQFKKENGHLDVPCTHPLLGRWVHNMTQQYEQMCSGIPVKVLNSEKIQELRNAGVDFFNEIQEEKQLIWNGKFELMFYKLKEYKEKHGNSCVSSFKNEYYDLYKWYCKILLEYRKSLGMENADTSLLSTRQIDRLKEIGFDFSPPTQLKRGKLMPFDERIKQLKDFQRNGGDISKITVYDKKFGSFIHRQKREYLLWRKGQPSILNEKKIKVLESLGMKWDDVEKCVDPNDLGLTSEKKSWDERFQQLLEYKAKHGHLMVPQKTKDCLGIWVKDQRRCYRLMKQGVRGRKIRGMNEERVKKLSDIGFIFDAKKGWKKFNHSHYNLKTSTFTASNAYRMNVEENDNNKI